MDQLFFGCLEEFSPPNFMVMFLRSEGKTELSLCSNPASNNCAPNP